MDFSLTEDQQLMVDGFTELMNSEAWEKYFHECDENSEYPERWVKAICDLGFDRILLPEEYDGLGLGWQTLAAAYEALGRAGGPTYVLYQLPGWDRVIREGTEEQKKDILKFVGSGKQMLNYAMTEPSAGSSWDDMSTTYSRKGGKVYLNGHKTFITSSMKVPYLVVMARDADNMGTYTEWFVDMSLPGITKEPLHKLGLRMDSCADIYFDNVELREEDLFGTEGNGFKRGVKDFDLERFEVALTNYGTAYCAFEDAAKYANQRVQGGEAIARKQLIQLKFADMKVDLTNMRNMLYEIAWKADNDQLGRGDCSMAKYYCSHASARVVDNALQTLAGVGVTGEHRVQRFYRDLRVDRVSGGTDEMMILAAGRGALRDYRS
ncbi:crotonobetainyl-CoA dehydrogenase [Propionibacterium freudenreichii]|uniref:crotonobetainyl-CoA dehydrogenase n=1 Tax=Propionibacterium freudenreichii TaxID=1744 RepID=UPI000542DB08|nr:crotonobetainyl-CoA dehydrogenase [Propionibacterium freudenreichii]AJQ89951.1 Crotonobetainyl-CoA dehydrogenase [Propionibacterium freudenreichii subsp. freudenreichii]MDK9343094.1 crotonobetainyl-CoA dehydrogenase [Propionibacterium freudenreichii]MDK9644699.1 crotonobetainyl-CoA dehydrogenase [Propionibacterium freudenreichii]CEG86559.1 Crotonobetainyl-CoA dehydrogenase (Crotonobetainyl-CoA reductase) [Propionibacterium freudenreichii]CEG91084.1 Crotonobetainyl-CoA dehydrogenase (Crotono